MRRSDAVPDTRKRFYAREASFWWPWLRLLPEAFDTPLYYTAEKLEALQVRARLTDYTADEPETLQ
jgi:hypothetical protein